MTTTEAQAHPDAGRDDGLAGRVAVITGGASGIGRALALALLVVMTLDQTSTRVFGDYDVRKHEYDTIEPFLWQMEARLDPGGGLVSGSSSPSRERDAHVGTADQDVAEAGARAGSGALVRPDPRQRLHADADQHYGAVAA